MQFLREFRPTVFWQLCWGSLLTVAVLLVLACNLMPAFIVSVFPLIYCVSGLLNLYAWYRALQPKPADLPPAITPPTRIGESDLREDQEFGALRAASRSSFQEPPRAAPDAHRLPQHLAHRLSKNDRAAKAVLLPSGSDSGKPQQSYAKAPPQHRDAAQPDLVISSFSSSSSSGAASLPRTGQSTAEPKATSSSEASVDPESQPAWPWLQQSIPEEMSPSRLPPPPRSL